MKIDEHELGLSQERPARAPLEGSAQAVVLEVLRHGPISRADLARRLGLSSPSLTRLTKPLLRAGLVRERAAELLSATGRPSLPLEVVGEDAYFVGVKIVRDAVFSVLTDFGGDVVLQRRTPFADPDLGGVLDLVVTEVAALRASGHPVRAVGIAIGGMVADQTSVWEVPALGWGEVDLGALLAPRIGLPVTVENDVKAFTQAEHWFGAGRGLSSFAVVTVGLGVGCGFVLDDQLVTGHRGLAGQLDHWPLDPQGPLCRCGRHGCAEVLLSSGWIARRAGEALGREVTFEETLALATAGDPLVTPVVREVAYQLGRFTALVANFVGPERILLSGDGIGSALLAPDEVRRGLRELRDVTALGHTSTDDDLVMEEFEFFTWARGAAAVAIRSHVLQGC